MAINISQEETLALSSKDRYDILNFAMEAAENSGFVSGFIFERAMYVYASIMLDEENAEAIRKAASNDLIEAWDMLVGQGIIQKLAEIYSAEFNVLADEGKIWFDEYVHYITSARGILSFAEQFTGDIIGQAAERLKATAEETGVENIINIADSWGMNRLGSEAPQKDAYQEKDIESLFV